MKSHLLQSNLKRTIPAAHVVLLRKQKKSYQNTHNRKNGKTTVLCLEMMINLVCNLTQQEQLAALSKNITINGRSRNVLTKLRLGSANQPT
jgi:endonuclease/exonuclease/phosphatase (EEP) superfamily protein YafD